MCVTVWIEHSAMFVDSLARACDNPARRPTVFLTRRSPEPRGAGKQVSTRSSGNRQTVNGGDDDEKLEEGNGLLQARGDSGRPDIGPAVRGLRRRRAEERSGEEGSPRQARLDRLGWPALPEPAALRRQLHQHSASTHGLLD